MDEAPDPKPPGADCTLTGPPNSGLDDCAAGSFCWQTSRTMGVCAAYCSPEVGCGDGAVCIGLNGVVWTCADECDVVAQDCADGNSCHASSGGDGLCFPGVYGAGYGERYCELP